ncbi:MAG TPA: TonB-dependent receptor, partial [Candidatus Solibacter sp.]|nr:TonB-dependent receptor [Candidatus Solibacter sp.]
LDPVAQSILAVNAKIPQYATLVPTANDFNHNTYTWGQENNLYQYFPTTRVDYYPTQKEQLTFTWNYYHSWQVGARRLPVPEINRSSPFRLGYFVWAVALQSTITPTVLNEFRYGTQHSGDSNASATKDYGSYYSFNNKPLRIGTQLPGPNGSANNGPLVPYVDQQNVTGRHFITTITDNLTKIHNSHTIAAGLSFRRTDWKDTAEVFPIPTYTTGTPSGDPLPSQLFTTTTLPGVINSDTGNGSGATALYNLLTGRIASASLRTVVDPKTLQYGGPINYTWTRSYMGGLYVQDRWRIKPNLTLNYGLRWEVQGDMYDVSGITAVPDLKSIYGPSVSLFTPGTLSGNNDPTAAVGRHPYPPDYKNFAPNVGISYNPRVDSGILGKIMGGSRTVLRGSYGITYYDEGTQMFAGNLGPNFGKSATQTLIAGQSVLPTFTTLNDLVNSPPPNSAFTFPAYQPVIHQSNLTFNNGMNGMNPHLRAPYTINWTLGIQRELMKNTVLEVRYVGNQAHHPWRTSNLNEINIYENGFLQEFQSAKKNLDINIANGRGQTFQNNGLAGQVALPIFDAAFGPRGTVPAIAAASGYQSAGFIANLQNGEAGVLANTLATNQNYVCRMFGSNFAPCGRVPVSATQQYTAPGVYPINFFMLNPYVSQRLAFVDDSGWNSYNGLQTQFRKQFSKGLTWTFNYTFSKSLTNLAADDAQQNVDWTTLRDKTMDRRPSLFDIKHVIQTFGTYDIPVGKGRHYETHNRILDTIVGGWTAGSVIVFNTGQPVRLGGQYNTVNNNNYQSSGVILAPGVTLDQIADAFHGQPLTRLTGRAGNTDLQRLAVPSDLVGPDGRANPKYLVVNTTPGQWGQILYIYGKHSFNWDASLTKTFKITERMNFQLYGSALNVLNHPTWGLGNTNVFSTTFGVVGAPSGSRSMSFRGTVNF